MSNWTFITNYGAVLSAIAKYGKVKAIDIALELDLTERTVRRIIHDLEAEGYVFHKREGAVNRYRVNPDMSLRRSEMRYVKIKDLMKAFSLYNENPEKR
jgi:predicted ArsR family transcriptional regulator